MPGLLNQVCGLPASPASPWLLYLPVSPPHHQHSSRRCFTGFSYARLPQGDQAGEGPRCTGLEITTEGKKLHGQRPKVLTTRPEPTWTIQMAAPGYLETTPPAQALCSTAKHAQDVPMATAPLGSVFTAEWFLKSHSWMRGIHTMRNAVLESYSIRNFPG